jgi:multiple sugar transport system substrate-binding protein
MSRDTFRIAVRKFDAFEKAIVEQWKTFAAAEGCALRLEAVPMDLHPLHEATFGGTGLTDGSWDVAFTCTDWLAEADQRQQLVDLGPHLRRDPPAGYPDGWSPGLLRCQTFGDRVLGLPYHGGPECLMVRKDLFNDPAERAAYRARFGAELRVPKTWDEFHQVARFFTRPERKLWGTVFAAYPDGHNTVYDACLQVWTRGGEIFSPSGRLLLDTPQVREGLAFYRTLLNDAGAVHPDSRSYDSVKSGLAFARGEVAMMVNWFGFAAMGDADPASPVYRQVELTTLPGSTPASLSVYWLLGIAAGSPHADLAWRFLRHCAQPANDRLLTLTGAIGCRRSTWSDPEVLARWPYFAQMDALYAAAHELPRVAHFAKLAEVMDRLVLAAADTTEPIDALCSRFQAQADALAGDK